MLVKKLERDRETVFHYFNDIRAQKNHPSVALQTFSCIVNIKNVDILLKFTTDGLFHAKTL